MLIDATTLPPDHVVRTDVCIVGAGPGGLSVATRLAGTALGVVVLDAGAEDAEQTPADVHTRIGGTNSGDAYPAVDVVRSQGVGGTAVQWLEAGQSYGVRLKRLEEQDFQRRDWMPHSGWPFGRAELEPFYDRAEDAFLVGRFADDITAASPESVRHPLAVGPLTAAEFRFSRRYTLLEGQRAAFTGRGNVDVYTRSTVTELDDGHTPGVVDRAHVRSAPGRGFTVQARWFVLAAGGIGNPHLLLLSNRTRPEGLGNEHDNVGRFFADHPAFNHVGVRLHDPRLIARLGEYDTADRGGVGILRAVSIDADVLEREQLMHSWTTVHPRVSRRYVDTIAAARDVVSTVKERPLGAPAAALRHVATIARGARSVVEALQTGTRQHVIPTGWAQRPLPPRLFEPGVLALSSTYEQAPNPDSRITLGSTRDDLGQRRVHLDYRWSELDLRTARGTTELVGRALAAAGIGELLMPTDHEYPDHAGTENSGHHPLGTTRMSADPKQGVVDGDGRMHTVANVSIVGSSTFPTGGSANPTLTLVALALRLGDHLRAALA